MLKNLSYFLIILLASCSAAKKAALNNNPDLLSILMSKHQKEFADILKNKDSLNVQIIYTQINRNENNILSFTNYSYNLNPKNYFYPASTVKMPIALLALEKLHELNIPGVDKNTTMITDSNSSRQQIVYTQPLAKDSRPTIANYIKQIFLVSDNDAFNRLYEFLGQEYILNKLKEKGYPDAVIRHRLNIFLTNEQNKTTNPIAFYDTAGNVLYRQPAQYNQKDFSSLNVKLGKGYYKGNELIYEPFDFSNKNRVYLQDLHDILQSIVFSEQTDAKKRFNISEEDYAFVIKWMSSYPHESKYPSYDSTYHDAFCKFLLYGADKNNVLPNVRIFNKVGDAYGFLIDNAYVIDKKNNVEFILCATISCNTDGIYNDDKYDYENIGYPFMKHLGQLIYQYELKRAKKHKALLNKFDIQYGDE